MGEKAIMNRLKKLESLEAEKVELEKQIDNLKEELKRDMDQKNLEELKVGSFVIRWKKVLSNRFDSKAFQKDHGKLYKQYLKQSESRRFTIA